MLRFWQLCSLDLYYCMLVSRMSLKEGFINNVLWRHTLHFDVWQKGILPHIRYLFHISRILNTQQDIRILLLLLCRSLCNITEWCEFGSLGKNIHCRVKQRRASERWEPAYHTLLGLITSTPRAGTSRPRPRPHPCRQWCFHLIIPSTSIMSTWKYFFLFHYSESEFSFNLLNREYALQRTSNVICNLQTRLSVFFQQLVQSLLLFAESFCWPLW